MKNGKAPCPEGISVEFYKRFWPFIGDDFDTILIKLVHCRQATE